MSLERRFRRWPLLWAAVALLGACATGSQRAVSPPRQGFRLDTETVSRMRHVAAASHPAAGSLASMPVQSGVSTLVHVAPVLLAVFQEHDGEEKLSDLDVRLRQCVQGAESGVNQRFFGNRPPTREECGAEVDVDECGEPITRAMLLGKEKHAVALECMKAVLSTFWPAPFSIEQRYRFYRHARVVEAVSPAEEKRLIEQDCRPGLWGTIKPDIVLHADSNLLKALFILDLKFPCPDTNRPEWTVYGKKSAYWGFNQKMVYEAALDGEAKLFTPKGYF